MGGIEQVVRNLGAALAARGHSVRLDTRAAPADFAVAVNDARLLPAGAASPILWLHNEVGLWRELRRGRMPALLRHRPAAVFCGARQAAQASSVLPFRFRVTLPHGLPARILQAVPAGQIPGPEVIYASQAYRGLADVIALWRSRVAPAYPAVRLRAYIAAEDVGRYRVLAAGAPSIEIRPRVTNGQMPEILRRARVMVAPGHPSETFCLAAAEAIAMGVPVVTLGHGALGERVDHGKTGLIGRDLAELAAHIGNLLDDHALWQRLHEAGLATRREADWDHVARLWEDAFIRRSRSD